MLSIPLITWPNSSYWCTEVHKSLVSILSLPSHKASFSLERSGTLRTRGQNDPAPSCRSAASPHQAILPLPCCQRWFPVMPQRWFPVAPSCGSSESGKKPVGKKDVFQGCESLFILIYGNELPRFSKWSYLIVVISSPSRRAVPRGSSRCLIPPVCVLLVPLPYQVVAAGAIRDFFFLSLNCPWFLRRS